MGERNYLPTLIFGFFKITFALNYLSKENPFYKLFANNGKENLNIFINIQNGLSRVMKFGRRNFKE
jgi:hypothetical protein